MGLYNSKVLFDWLLCRRELIYGGAYTCGNNKISNFNLATSTFHVQQSKFCFCAKIQVEKIPWGGGGGLVLIIGVIIKLRIAWAYKWGGLYTGGLIYGVLRYNIK